MRFRILLQNYFIMQKSVTEFLDFALMTDSSKHGWQYSCQLFVHSSNRNMARCSNISMCALCHMNRHFFDITFSRTTLATKTRQNKGVKFCLTFLFILFHRLGIRAYNTANDRLWQRFQVVIAVPVCPFQVTNTSLVTLIHISKIK